MEKIRKGDEVIVLTGRDKKRRGTVLQRIDADHVLVEGINVVKKQSAKARSFRAASSTKPCPFTFRMWLFTTPKAARPIALV